MINRIITAIKETFQGKPLSLRSSKWEEVRNNHIKSNPFCKACASVENLQVHHKKPFHISPELELDPNNLITLCENNNGYQCHLKIGHLGNWKDYNPNVDKDATEALLVRSKKKTDGIVQFKTKS